MCFFHVLHEPLKCHLFRWMMNIHQSKQFWCNPAIIKASYWPRRQRELLLLRSVSLFWDTESGPYVITYLGDLGGASHVLHGLYPQFLSGISPFIYMRLQELYMDFQRFTKWDACPSMIHGAGILRNMNGLNLSKFSYERKCVLIRNGELTQNLFGAISRSGRLFRIM